jgi:hypothetical protein
MLYQQTVKFLKWDYNQSARSAKLLSSPLYMMAIAIIDTDSCAKLHQRICAATIISLFIYSNGGVWSKVEAKCDTHPRTLYLG